MPPWLEEGYSNVYGSMTLTDKGARLGQPDPEDMSVLFESPLLPLDLVFHVDRNSPYYTVGEKDTMFFAESRALVHFLLTDPQMTGAKALDQYVTRVEGGADALESARQVFGDLNQLQSRLEAYIKQMNAPPADIAIAGGSDSGGSAKTLSAAEMEARMGDFSGATAGGARMPRTSWRRPSSWIRRSRKRSRAWVFCNCKQNQLDDADKHFARALELDPNDALSYYGQGQVAMSRGGFVGVPVGAVTAFEKTVALNPDFAPAWYNLASIYAIRPETMQKALTDAQRAASLAPGESGYQLQVAAILERLGRTEEARKTATQVQSSASDPKAADKAGDLLAQISPKPQTSAPAASTSKPPAATIFPRGYLANRAQDGTGSASGGSLSRREPSPTLPLPPAAAPSNPRIFHGWHDYRRDLHECAASPDHSEGANHRHALACRRPGASGD